MVLSRLLPSHSSKIDGLEACTRLRKLELGKNEISAIENVEALAQLELLSLEDNVSKMRRNLYP